MKHNTFTSYAIILAIVALVLPIFIQADVSPALASSVFQSPLPSETPEPTDEPTDVPTDEPTAVPTDEPTVAPTSTPTTQPTSVPTDEPTPDPIQAVTLVLDLPSTVEAGQSFSGSIVAQNVSEPGIYGVQLELLFDTELITIDSAKANNGFDYVMSDNADNTNGKIVLIASKTGRVPGLTGNVTLLTFEATAKNATGTAEFTFNNTKLSDPQATPIEVTSTNGSIVVEGDATPVPTDEPTPEPTDEPTPVPTDEPTPVPTDEPTPEPTPTDEPTPEPTDEPTPVPTDEPTPVPTVEPGKAEVIGQVILAGRTNNDWSGAEVSANGAATTNTDTNGDFSLVNIPAGPGMIFTADAPGYLSAVCTEATVATPETVLNAVTLLSGDITNDDKVDIEDATAVGVSFDQTGSGLAADINQDEVIDIFDLVLVSINFGAEGPQAWDCQ
ncbi:MAG: hypothetical protein KDJ52_21770 [Anaerolineae bacterium]|nr:hypothetical protein [Anaerolineae bacterium]